MPLIKTLSQTLKQDKEKFKVPRSVQQAIPIRKIWPDGIFQVESKFSRTFRFTDINYSIASKADKTEMFLDYSELLNALDSGCTAKITLNNRKINKEEFEQSLLIPMKGDGLDEYRKEYNGYHHPSGQAVLHRGRAGCRAEAPDLPGLFQGRCSAEFSI
jgi:type IV secretory pathway VirB4 component